MWLEPAIDAYDPDWEESWQLKDDCESVLWDGRVGLSQQGPGVEHAYFCSIQPNRKWNLLSSDGREAVGRTPHRLLVFVLLLCPSVGLVVFRNAGCCWTCD